MSIYDNNPPVRINSSGAGTVVPLSTLPEYARVVNLTALGSLTSSSKVIEAEKFGSSSTFLTSATTSAVTKSVVTTASSGIVFRDKIPTEDTFGASFTVTSISQASQAVVSGSNIPARAGDILRCIDAPNMQQITTMDFSISSASGTGFTLTYLDTRASTDTSRGFTSAGGAAKFVIISRGIRATPRRAFITGITKATSAVVTLSATGHGIQLHSQVRFNGMDNYGMTQINGMVGNVTAVNASANTITLDIDSTNFSDFSFPVSSATPATRAQVIPVGVSTANVNEYQAPTTLRAEGGLILGSSVAGSANDQLAIFTDAEIPTL